MDYTFESIGGGLSVAVNASCRIGEDAMLLARFAGASPQDTACDLGTGNGIIPLLWCRRDPPAHITAVEREEELAAMAQAAVGRFSLQERLTVICTDWAKDAAMPAAGSMSLVTCNPPYFPFGAARPSADPLRRAARHEDNPAMLGTLCKAAARLLTPSGRFCLCHRPERLADVLAALQTAELTPRRLQFVQTHDKTAAWLFLLEAGHGGTLRVLPALVQHERGTHTATYKRLYI